MQRFAAVAAMRPHLRSLLLLVDIVRMIHSAARGKCRDVPSLARRLEDVVFDYLKTFLAAYSTQHFKPKHHMLVHIPSQILNDGMVFWCFTNERKHIDTKAAVSFTKTLRDQTRGVFGKLVLSQLRRLESQPWNPALLGKPADFPELANALRATSCQLSTKMRWRGQEIAAGSHLFIDGLQRLVCSVACYSASGGDFGILAEPYCKIRGDTILSEWRLEGATVQLPLQEILSIEIPSAWRFTGDHLLQILH